ncbi:PASTA domain-containing protein, partial [Lactobacillus sp. XV13L]|nr:PASTA domain-containing protein [Lactobacillus sp. XV13L]
DKGKQTQRSAFAYSLRKYKWWWLFVGLAALVVVGLMFLVLSNRGNGDVRIPDVTNLSERSAREKLETMGLKVGRIKHKSSASIDSGRVIETSPPAGEHIKRGRYIDLYVSDGSGMVQVPDVTGADYRSAVEKLEKMGFDVIRENQFADDVPPDHVIAQSIAAGVEVKPNQTTITLTVSKGRDDHVKRNLIKLPNFKDYSLREVKRYVKKHDLALQVNTTYSDTVKKNMIVSMSPAAGTKVPSGSTITVSVSEGPK